MRPIYEYDVYKLSESLSDIIWEEFDKWDNKTKFSIGHQIIRSADSICANLAEGFGRLTGPDRKKFYYYSRGSFEETKAWLRKLERRGIISLEKSTTLNSITSSLGPKLTAFIKSTY